MKLRVLAASAALVGIAAAANTAQAGYKPDDRSYGPGEATGAPAKLRRKALRHAPYRDCCGVYRFVYAESWYGFKRVVAPVRRAELGDQVRLPGGSWVYCEFSCEYTLRKQSLDFWEGVTGQGQNVSPGYFRKDFYIDDYGHRRGYLF